jgi:hypothetical protein
VSGQVRDFTSLNLTASLVLNEGHRLWPLLTTSIEIPDVESVSPIGSSPEARILDVLAGGRYAHASICVALVFHHWNHDNAHSDSTYAYPYPDMTFQKPLHAKLGRAEWVSAPPGSTSRSVQAAVAALKEHQLALLLERGRQELLLALEAVREVEALPF